MKLRCYQSKAVEAVRAQFAAAIQRTLAVIPTGGGKTVVAGHVAKERLAHGRVMVLVHRDELARQAGDKFGQITGVLPTYEKADERSDEANMHGKPPVVIASIQTLSAAGGRRLKRFDPSEFSLVWVDEAHHAPAGTWRTCIDHFAQNPNCKILGVTATADRADGEALGQVFQSVAYNYDLPDIIADGYLVPIRQRSVTLEGADFAPVRTTAGDLNAGDLEEVMLREKPLHGVAQATIEAAVGLEAGTLAEFRDRDDRVSILSSIIGAGPPAKRTLVFTVSVAHAEMLAEIINRWMPESADFLDGSMTSERRKTVLRKFKNGDLRFLINCMVATEGFDEPGVELVVIARPTKSRALYSQMCGRGTRPHESIAHQLGDLDTAEARKNLIAISPKPWVEVMDFSGNCGRHKLVNTADILGAAYEPEVVEMAKAMAAEASVDMTDALRQSKEEVERKRREAEEKKRRREEEEERRRQARAAKRAGLVGTTQYQAHDVDPFDSARPNVSRRSSGGSPFPSADPRIPTKQLSLMAKAKVPPEDVAKMSPETASRVTQEIVRGWKLGLRSYRQAKCLLKYGFNQVDLRDMSEGDARAHITAIAANGWRRPSETGAA